MAFLWCPTPQVPAKDHSSRQGMRNLMKKDHRRAWQKNMNWSSKTQTPGLPSKHRFSHEPFIFIGFWGRRYIYIYINIWYMILYYVFFAGMAFAWAIPRRCNAFEAATLGSWCSPQSSDCTETQQVSQHENCVVSALCICTFPWFGMSWQVPIFWYMNLWGQSQNNFIQFLVQSV